MRRVVLICCLIGGGCSSITTHPIFDQPAHTPLQLTVSTEPPPDADGLVARDAVVRLSFDDYPDPATAVFGPLLLRSGTSNFDVTMTVDLLDKSITVQPRSLLAAGTQYEMVVGSDVRALSGRTVGSTMVAPISVGDALAPSPSPSPSPVPQLTWDQDISPLLSTCAPYCHTVDRCPGRAGKRNPSRDLDLSIDPATPLLGMINVPSVALEGTDRSMLRVQPGDSANSMLMRKLLGGDPHADTSDPPTANLAVPGRRMPLYESACGEALAPPEDTYLSDDKLRVIQTWIDQGAAIH